MGRMTILILLLASLITTGCATPYARQWQSQLWTRPNESDTKLQELGKLETEGLTFGVINVKTPHSKAPEGRPSNAVIGIGVSCRNQTEGAFSLDLNPIQVINASNLIIKPLPLDHVMYKFYGGTLREIAQINRLSRPLGDYGNSLAENILTAVVNVYRSYENRAIITEFHRKEALPYDLSAILILEPGADEASVNFKFLALEKR